MTLVGVVVTMFFSDEAFRNEVTITATAAAARGDAS
jgi:hypothetical protein